MAPTLDGQTRTERAMPVEVATAHRQHRQMLVALGLLLVALVVVLVKDRDFWFPSVPGAEDSTEESAPGIIPTAQTPAAEKNVLPAPAIAKPKSHSPVHAEQQHISAAPANSAQALAPSIIATNRAALPPLEVEVVTDGQPTVLQPNNHSVKVDLQGGSPASPAAASGVASSAAQPPALATNAGERVRLSPDTAEMVDHPAQPNYPMLAKEMKVQGSVVLQALIGQEGAIQDLRVLSGPAILSTAAMDAVRQWRFRPYFQSGQAVETEARITVNFTISTN